MIFQIRALAIDGVSTHPVDFSGLATLELEERLFQANLYVRPSRNRYRLVIDPEDIRNFSDRLPLKNQLTPLEVRMISLNPTRAPGLMHIRDRARDASRELGKLHHAFPEGAYRHVLWSYLLTKTYGPEFAREVTDAHEVDTVKPPDPADRVMDLRNNALGRAYAMEGLAESKILDRMMLDLDAVLRPEG